MQTQKKRREIVSRRFLRKVRDSNPRYSKAVQRISSPPRSITPATFLNIVCFLQCKITHFPDTAQFYRKKFGGELKYGLPVGINRGGFSWTYCPHRAALSFDSPCHNRARFCETGYLFYLCISKKRKSAGFSSFRVLGANYPI